LAIIARLLISKEFQSSLKEESEAADEADPDKRNPPQLKDKQIEPDNEFDGAPGKSGDRDEISGKDEVKKEASKEEEPMDVDDVKSEDKKEPATVAASS